MITLPMNIPAYQNARRMPMVPLITHDASSSQDVSDASDRVEQLLRRSCDRSCRETRDEHVHDVRVGIEAVAPHVRQDHRLADDLSGVAHQVFEQRKFSRAKLERVAASRDPPRQQVHREVADGEARRFGRAGARRTSAWTRAISSANAKGFVR